MTNYNFKQIKNVILDWSNVLKDKYPKIVEEIKSSSNMLLLDFGFENCVAQIVVNEPTFAPYKYVSFEALDSKRPLDSKNTFQLDYIYVYYDSEYSTMEETLGMLDYGVSYCLNYEPDKLAKLYIGKRGIINSINIVFSRNEKFECVDVQYQYLVVSNKKLTVKVLPEIFIITE